jgi:hypothetical protein
LFSTGDVNVPVDAAEAEEVDFKEITQEKALELLKVRSEKRIKPRWPSTCT